MAEDFNENDVNNENRKTFFCSPEIIENTQLFGWCVGKIVYKWIGGIITILGGGTTAAMNYQVIIEFFTNLF